MGLLSSIFKIGEIKLDKNYCMTSKEMRNIDPSLYPNVFPIWCTDENCLYMLYKQDNGKTKLECLKEMEWVDDPVVLYPAINEEGKLTWELNYLSAEDIDNIPEVNIIGKSAYEIWKDLGNEGSEEDFINSLRAIDGQDGKDGQTPIIEVGDNGNWYVDGIDTGAQAKGDKGDKGDPGDTPFIGNNGNWYVSGRDTLMPARGEKGQDGKSAYNIWRSLNPENSLKTEEEFINSLKGSNGIDGITPTIGDNGHWFIGDEDTNIPVRGATGEKGSPGEDGRDGKSAYEIWLSNGNEGTKDDFLGTLKGQDGTTPVIGDNGNWFIDGRDSGIRAIAVDGKDGHDGKSAYEIWKYLEESNINKNEFEFFESLKGDRGDKGDPGEDGQSAYELWLSKDNTGTEEDFIDSLKGRDGTAAVTPSISSDGNWVIGTQDTGILARGTNGKSAYDIWKTIEGNEDKTEEEFLSSLKGIPGEKGEDGTNGINGKSAYDIWKDLGNEGTEEDYLNSIKGDRGLSAYEIWKESDESNVDKTEADFLASLKGEKGNAGLSAYDIWLSYGNEGSEMDFLNYLKAVDGITPTIGDNGHWFIGDIDTGVPATGERGLDGLDGQDGNDGVTPIIGDNGNWFIGDFDTGCSSTGEKGQDGKSAYEIWRESGHEGTAEDFIEYLKGKDASKTSIGSSFETVQSDLNIPFSDPEFQNKLTYMLATSSTAEGEPPNDSMIINAGWNNNTYGYQIALGLNNDTKLPYMYIRISLGNNEGYTAWYEIISRHNYSEIINETNNQLLTKQGTFVNYDQGAGGGQAGYINFARITIIDNYANHSCFFVIQRRNLGFPIFLSVGFMNENNLDPGLGTFYYWGSTDYGIYISKKDVSTWDLWSLKSEAYDVVEILQMNVNMRYFKIEFPNGYRDVKEEQWISPTEAGRVAGANHIYDVQNGYSITGSYSKPGLNYSQIQWLNCWNGYEMRAIHKNIFTYLKKVGEYYGLCIPYEDGTGQNDSTWIRTTKEGIIPYQLGVDSAVGTSSWPFREIHGNQLNTNTIHQMTPYQTGPNGFAHSLINFNRGNILFTGSSSSTNGIVIQVHVMDRAKIFPEKDNTAYLGSLDKRWNQIYSTNAVIQTSDRNQKKDISYIGEDSEYENTNMSDELLIQFVRSLKPCVYLRRDGESGRPHHGFISEDFKKSMDEAGIADHAAYIKSPKMETIEKEVEQEREVYDEVEKKTKIVKEKIKIQEEKVIEGEYNEGLRYEEIVSDITRFSQILYDQVQEQQKLILLQQEEINDLKTRMENIEKLLNI